MSRSFADLSNVTCRRVADGDGFDDIVQGGIYIKSAVNYCSGARMDMAGYERAARKSGALIIWNLSHATGVVAMDMHSAGVKLVTGCTYKYLNGGPGAPSFIYASSDIVTKLDTPLPGWMGSCQAF